MPKTSQRQQLLSSAEALVEIARISTPITSMTLNRWIHEGKRTSSGERIRLASVRRDGRNYVTRESLASFLKQTRRRVSAAT